MRRPLLRAIVAGVAVSTIATAALLATGATAAEEQTSDPITMGFYPRWSWSDDHDFMLKEVHESGAADSMTHLAYAFAVIDENGACTTKSWGDYTSSVSAERSVDGVADQPDERLWGQFNQLRKLKELNPDLKVLISLGGPGTKGAFEAVAATPESRARFAQNCVDTFLRGNLPVDGDRGGNGAAAGVFDGIDIDWEWAEDPTRQNYTALHQEFARVLDEAETELGREFTLSTTFPGFVSEEPDGTNGDRADGYDVPELFQAVDFAHLQVYSMYAPWGDGNWHTAFHSQHRDDPESNQYDLSVGGAKSVQYLIDQGAPPEKIVYGIPAFGRGWTGVPSTNNGVHQTGTGPAAGRDDQGTLWYDDILGRTDGEHFFDQHAVSGYYYDGNDWISYDSVRSVRAKAQYVQDNGLGGMMLWNLLQNQDGELTNTMAEAQAS